MTSLPNPSLSARASIPSPLTTQLFHLSSAQRAALPYPPDIFPGARDVRTSYGSMRVYEWGEEMGRKLMLVHGDATPAPLWKVVAEGLVKRGCRVIVLDLWGRGYSCSPNVVHDSRLFGLQLLFAASSSPLPWCTETFGILGFSLGGGIAMDFVASFPHLVWSIALLAPVGLLRSLPKEYVELQQAAREGREEAGLRRLLAGVLGVARESAAGQERIEPAEMKGADGAAIQGWQFLHHEGHAASFISTLQHGPLQGQLETWRGACQVLKDKHKACDGRQRLVVVCGREDNVVLAQHVQEDIDVLMGPEEYVFKLVNGGHGFLLESSACRDVVDVLMAEWDL